MSRPEATQALEPLALDDVASVSAARLQLLERTGHELDIHLPSLESTVLANDAEQDQLRRIATSGRRARIRLLLHDAAGSARGGHRLLALAQRLPSVLQIRMPLDESDLAHRAAFIINDSGGYLLLPDATRANGRASLRDRASQAPLRRFFDQVWERSQRAVEWQRLDI